MHIKPNILKDEEEMTKKLRINFSKNRIKSSSVIKELKTEHKRLDTFAK